jgi:hypothetical protein
VYYMSRSSSGKGQHIPTDDVVALWWFPALLLHPDKNDHVNSEGAFKLVSKVTKKFPSRYFSSP